MECHVDAHVFIGRCELVRQSSSSLSIRVGVALADRNQIFMAQLLSNEDEVLEAYDPSIAAARRFKSVQTEIFFSPPPRCICSTCRHPIAVFFHLAFRSLAIVAYFVCSWAKVSFVTSFVVIVILLSMDFWTVKNITGRLLAGLRYWNYVDETGNNHWIFESRKVSFMVQKVRFRQLNALSLRAQTKASSHRLNRISSGHRSFSQLSFG